MPETVVEGRTEPLAGGVRQSVLVVGACSMIMGVALAVWPHKSLPTAELLCGGYLLLNGVFQMILAVSARFATALRALVLISGVMSALLAMLCFAGGNSALLLAFWIGLAWAIRGICHATVTVWVDDLPGRGRQEVFGLITLTLGVIIGALPFDSLDAVSWVAGLCLIAIGAMEVLSVTATTTRAAMLPGTMPTAAWIDARGGDGRALQVDCAPWHPSIRSSDRPPN